MEASEARFRVMASGAHVVLVGASDGLVEQAQRRLDELEARWSRFIETSDVTRLNARPGEPVPVHEDTIVLVSAAVEGWRRTKGLFDPTVLPSVMAAGYVGSIDDSTRRTTMAAPVAAGPGAGCDGIEVDPIAMTVTLARGTAFDPGGVGKGLAADLVAEEMVAAGAAGVLVNIGGDLRVEGSAPSPHGWVIAVEDPYDDSHVIAQPALADGAVATSCILTRSWVTDGEVRHHLIDTATGRPSRSGAVSATVIAGTAWLAEAFSKAAVLAGPEKGIDLLEAGGVTGLIVAEGGSMKIGPSLGVFV